ncbi:hypothetical protein WICPIJ_009508 [Wickerhamomyces pijperi]|uniref:MICOS complex subunit n=1 Tax=Wickerhamomyces pijperi TaxID=599730 RepID=A0A9P8PMB5_WICPI|nr:hypothetical protein WICPIJ_009508 [Wickerhamomyces pijperi]
MSSSKKQSRSFYQQDEEVAPISTPIEQQSTTTTSTTTKPTTNEVTGVVSEYIEGYKIQTSSFLEAHSQVLRSALAEKVNYVEAEYNNLKSAATNEWNTLTSNIVSVYDPRDQFLPSFIYALTTTLTGSILVSKRSLPVRFITPLVFAIGSFKYFLPLTYNNTKSSIKSWEAESTPELLEFQKSVKGFASDLEDGVVKTGDSLNQGLIDLVHQARTAFSSEK